MIYLGADHAGYYLKEELKPHLKELGYEFADLGAKEFNPKDDYPDFARLVGEKVSGTENLGILVCGTGLGMCLAVNKLPEIRGALVWNDFTAKQAKEHLNANVLCLAGKVLDGETAKRIVSIWLKQEFSDEPRHQRRLDKVSQLAGK